jgi:hypothetical protein
MTQDFSRERSVYHFLPGTPPCSSSSPFPGFPGFPPCLSPSSFPGSPPWCWAPPPLPSFCPFPCPDLPFSPSFLCSSPPPFLYPPSPPFLSQRAGVKRQAISTFPLAKQIRRSTHALPAQTGQVPYGGHQRRRRVRRREP